jgi:integrase
MLAAPTVGPSAGEPIATVAAHTRIQCYRVLSAALKQGVRWQVVAVNPATAVSPPRAERPSLRVPNVEAVRHLVDATDDDALRVALLIAATTGLRREEIVGLRWSSLDGSALRVTATLPRVRAKGLVYMDPKTDRSRQSVILPPVTVAALKVWRKQQTERRCCLVWRGMTTM